MLSMLAQAAVIIALCSNLTTPANKNMFANVLCLSLLQNYYSHIHGSCEMLVLAEACDSNIEVCAICCGYVMSQTIIKLS
jgi:hypothetical protein